MPLTDLAIKKLKVKETRYDVLDVKGLALRIMPTGVKVWTCRFMIDGKPKRMTLGRYPTVSLSQAREKHALAVQDVERGIDPSAKQAAEKEKRKAEPTFGDLLDEYWEKELSKTASRDERKRLVTKDALPAWKSRKVSSIRRRDAVLLLDDVRDRAPIVANRLHSILVRMFNFASERGIIDFSPLDGMRRGEESTRERVLTDDEIKNLWSCMDLERADVNVFHMAKLALKGILLTGQRPGEVAGMKWEQIEDDWWILPPELTKTRTENRVPILPMMSELIEQAKKYSASSEYVFVSPRNPLCGFNKSKKAEPREADTSISVWAMSYALRHHREKLKMVDLPFYTPHDLRRTLRTRLAEVGVSDVIGERIMGHKLPGVLGIYNRHSYDIEKRQALALWERRLQELLGVADPQQNVVPFEARRQ